MPTKERIYYLLNAYTTQTASQEEENELMHWALHAKEDDSLRMYMQNAWNDFSLESSENNVDWNSMFENIIRKDKVATIHSIKGRIRWSRVAAATIALVLISVAGYYYFYKNTQQEIAKNTSSHSLKNGITAPTNNRAMITLSDGNKVYLDSLQNGEVAAQGNIKLVKLSNGQIAYQSGSGEIINEIKYNTLTNPRGSKVIDIKLADGTQVWLNAGSSITYPIAFVGDQRKVELTGEGYFEVAHNASKPFHVKVGEMDVKVLGTHFNVNAYGDEGEIKTTLLQGSVAVNAGKSEVLIKPGQLALLQTSSLKLQTTDNVDVEQVMAWKNGFFSFQSSNLKDVMQQIARWYNVEVKYEGVVAPRKFGGVISRDSNLDDVLKILEVSGVHFKLTERLLTVKP